MRFDLRASRRLLGAGLVLLLTLLLALGLPAPAPAAALIGSWRVVDDAGHGWGLSLFEQPDPAYPSGWRLRLNAHVPGVEADHGRPLRLRDGLGGAWTLTNCSDEMVPPGDAPGEAPVPAGSAQFDVAGLDPRPSAVAPLRLELPLAGGESVGLTLEGDVVPALRDLP
ncbi:DUF3122 domain-containing protein [Synechococcus sp. CS-1329]|uniref:DUF3122 domain-containing protein n=1 Tax=Synechococcus sp. CS-1329 TaxID=2847975 RepID=UPI00223B554A|nr:DUF3122 domain-containing protein [Synechococcus sp. CS-1329]MCT0219831.1 DUF3122 domain-containing protein [Synechococcus sp. CS-1329]